MSRNQRFLFQILICIALALACTTYKAMKLARYATDVAGQALTLAHKREAQTDRCLDALEYTTDAIDWSQQDVCE